MSEQQMQRWDTAYDKPVRDNDGPFVLASDVEAAIAAAEDHHDPGTRCDGCHSFGYEEGQRDMLANVPVDDLVALVRKLKEVAVACGADYLLRDCRDAEKQLAALRALGPATDEPEEK